jgi:hypothetical protein
MRPLGARSCHPARIDLFACKSRAIPRGAVPPPVSRNRTTASARIGRPFPDLSSSLILLHICLLLWTDSARAQARHELARLVPVTLRRPRVAGSVHSEISSLANATAWLDHKVRVLVRGTGFRRQRDSGRAAPFLASN